MIGSQILLGAIVFGWILGKALTWARATVAAAIFTLEMLILFGVVPNQWLALTQGTFEWTAQKIAFTLPSWLMLGNEVSISLRRHQGRRRRRLQRHAAGRRRRRRLPAPGADQAEGHCPRRTAARALLVRPHPHQGRALMARTDVWFDLPPFREDYQLTIVDPAYLTAAVKPKQFLHIDEAECILCEGCVDICPWKCIHYLSVDAIAEATNVDDPRDEPDELRDVRGGRRCVHPLRPVRRSMPHRGHLTREVRWLGGGRVGAAGHLRPVAVDSGQRDEKNGYAYGMRF